MKLLLLSLISILVINTYAQIPSYVPTNGLMGYWAFNNNSLDESGNGFDGNVTGATLSVNRFGEFNGAYSFNGSSDYIAVDYTFDYQSRTISCWFNPTTLLGTWNDAGHILAMDDDALTYGMVAIKIEDSVLSLRAGGEPVPFLDSITETGVWYNVTITRGLLNTYYYLNGVQIGSGLSGTSGSTVNPNPFLVIGSGRVYSPQNFNGKIDDVGIWNRVLSECEITELYTGTQCDLGIEELSNTPKQLIKITDLIGRETTFKPNTPLIYIYSDGTTEKVFKLD